MGGRVVLCPPCPRNAFRKQTLCTFGSIFNSNHTKSTKKKFIRFGSGKVISNYHIEISERFKKRKNGKSKLF